MAEILDNILFINIRYMQTHYTYGVSGDREIKQKKIVTEQKQRKQLTERLSTEQAEAAVAARGAGDEH